MSAVVSKPPKPVMPKPKKEIKLDELKEARKAIMEKRIELHQTKDQIYHLYRLISKA
jgi:hypothetical protein